MAQKQASEDQHSDPPPPHVSSYDQHAPPEHFKVTSNNHPLSIDSVPDKIIRGRLTLCKHHFCCTHVVTLEPNQDLALCPHQYDCLLDEIDL